MRVDWCVSSWFRIKNTHSLTEVPCRDPAGDLEFAPLFGDSVLSLVRVFSSSTSRGRRGFYPSFVSFCI